LRLFKGYESKICFYCASKYTQKYGLVGGKQRYRCHTCKRQFLGGTRIDPDSLWREYTEGKQTYTQLASKYKCSVKTIQRNIDKAGVKKQSCFTSCANVVMDTTYFGRSFGVMVFKDSMSRQILYKQFVKNETNKLYLSGIQEIARRGIHIQSIVCDGRKGLFQLFPGIPVQMCQFHQNQIIRRYLTNKPKSACAKDLKAICMKLTTSMRDEFELQLSHWYETWEWYINERTLATDTKAKRKSFYTHKPLRSAFRSIKTNMDWLFTHEAYKELMIPNTTNCLEGVFTDLKGKLNNHSGLSQTRKKKFIDGFFKV
jgi:hypothetical protein